MDEVSRYNRAKWNQLAQLNVEWSRPWLELDPTSARERLDPYGVLGAVAGKKVLCLANGGGQQSVAFAVLGAHVTVFDLSDTQLARDRLAAEHYGLELTMVQGDMRDLSQLDDDAFDLVWHLYSINFVPDIRPVFDGVARVLRPNGRYLLGFANPFTAYSVDEEAWDGEGYPLKHPYRDGVETTSRDPDWAYWDVETEDGQWIKVDGPQEFHHNLGTLINSLIARGFVLLGFWEDLSGDAEAEPGSWDHYKAFAIPSLTLWLSYCPEALKRARLD